jgi:hypothetical protein
MQALGVCQKGWVWGVDDNRGTVQLALSDDSLGWERGEGGACQFRLGASEQIPVGCCAADKTVRQIWKLSRVARGRALSGSDAVAILPEIGRNYRSVTPPPIHPLLCVAMAIGNMPLMGNPGLD